nr:HAMP domain-containing sensor histidine kinase [Tessaracoccus aquimaris]
MRRAWWVALAPVVVAGIIAAGLLVAGADTWLILSTRLSLTIALAGVVGSGAWLGARALRSRATRREAAVEARVRDQESQARHRFMRRLDHELKNPVTAIRTALAAQPTPGPAMGVVSAQARRLSTLVGDLAKLVDLDTRALEREPVDLRDVVDEAIEVLPPSDRRISVEFPQVPWPVPPVIGDRDLLSVAVFNLLSNAVKYSEPGARIEVRATEGGGVVHLDINDTGWGIPPAAVGQMWEELARGSTRAPSKGPASDCRSSGRSSRATAAPPRSPRSRGSAPGSRSASRPPPSPGATPADPPRASRVTLGARLALSMFGNSLSSKRYLHDPNANEQPNMLKSHPTRA